VAIKREDGRDSCLFCIRYYHQKQRVQKDNFIAIDHGKWVLHPVRIATQKAGKLEVFERILLWVPMRTRKIFYKTK